MNDMDFDYERYRSFADGLDEAGLEEWDNYTFRVDKLADEAPHGEIGAVAALLDIATDRILQVLHDKESGRATEQDLKRLRKLVSTGAVIFLRSYLFLAGVAVAAELRIASVQKRFAISN